MSVSLHIQVNKSMSLADLATASGKALNEIPNHSIEVVASFDAIETKGASNDCLSETAPLVLMRL